MSVDIWVPRKAGEALPELALQGGTDTDGSPIYVGRAKYNKDVLPIKIRNALGFVSYEGKEYYVQDYDVLCDTLARKYKWVKSYDGYTPNGSVPGGMTENGERLFIGRAHHNGSLTIGKVHPSHRCLYISYGGIEIKLNLDYEILVLKEAQ